jgi:hypothetical protein
MGATSVIGMQREISLSMLKATRMVLMLFSHTLYEKDDTREETIRKPIDLFLDTVDTLVNFLESRETITLANQIDHN